MMRVRHETWSSSGITKLNLGKSLFLGIILSAFMVFFNTVTKHLDTRQFLQSLSSSSKFWALSTFLVVGIGEEFGFRGYLQTRLVLWLGKTWGWVLASTIMALGHIIQRITIMGMTGMDALVSSLALLPISLLFGYIMLQTENLVTGALLHAIIDWNSVF
jgi:membrane protease YdiL (CAAX protease family)